MIIIARATAFRKLIIMLKIWSQISFFFSKYINYWHNKNPRNAIFMDYDV